MSANKSKPFRHGSMQKPDSSGGKLPPIPMSVELCEALDTEADENIRSPRDHALSILHWYFGLSSQHPDAVGSITRQKQTPMPVPCGNVLPFARKGQR